MSAIPREISIDDVTLHSFEDSLSAKKVSDHDHNPLIILHKKVYWHSSSHILGYALERLYGDRVNVELCDGPGLEDGMDANL